MEEKSNSFFKKLTLTFILYFVLYNATNYLIIKAFNKFFDYETYYGLFYSSIVIIFLVAIVLYIINRFVKINKYFIILGVIVLEVITFLITDISYVFTILIEGIIKNPQGITLEGVLLFLTYYMSFVMSHLIAKRILK